jgi:anaerobic magnesium-protoporphyrin IX monomethyl ester cyclase
MGVESGSQRILNAMDKGLLVEEVVAAREHLKKADIRACFFLQFGYPGEQWEDILKTVALVRETKPDDIGVSFSYPLPNTTFYDLVQEQLGAKRNWSDSDDLCVMFRGAYHDRFYRLIRDALHAEVQSWRQEGLSSASGREASDQQTYVSGLWTEIARAEPLSRDSAPTGFGPGAAAADCGVNTGRHQISAQDLISLPGGGVRA